jgi:transcriptional regulator with XRE-family HTH domain
MLTGQYLRLQMRSMPFRHSDIEVDQDAQNEEIAVRLCRVREALKLSQTQFAYQLLITRERLATYEDGRTPLRGDVGIRLCRQFFVSEFWLATGSVDEKSQQAGIKANFTQLEARLTMALAAERVALTVSPGGYFGYSFNRFLRFSYLELAEKQGNFPRIVFLPNDGPEYLQNALACAVEFWKAGLSDDQWQVFFLGLIGFANNFHASFIGKEPGAKTSAPARKK